MTQTFFKIFWRTSILFVVAPIPLVQPSGNVCPEFQSQGGSLGCLLCYLHIMGFLRFNSGATPANLLMATMAADPCTCTCVHKHWWDSTLRTSVWRSVSRHFNQWAMPARRDTKNWIQCISFSVICFYSLSQNVPQPYCSFHLFVFHLATVVFVQVHWT